MLRNTNHPRRKFKPFRKDSYYGDIYNDGDNEQEEQFYHKVSRVITEGQLRPSQHTKIIKSLAERVKRPNTARTRKKDYLHLKDLIDCNQKLFVNRRNNLERMKSLKKITDSKQKQEHFYYPLNGQIRKTQNNLKKKKNQKYSMLKLQDYYSRKISKKQQPQKDQIQVNNLTGINQFVGLILKSGIRQIKHFFTNNSVFHEKLKIFGEQFTFNQKEDIIQQAKSFLNNAQKGKKMSKKCQIYTLNHFLLHKFMLQIFKDSTILQDKQKNRKVYDLIKDQMIGELIDEDKFIQILKSINKFYDDSINIKSSLKQQNNFTQNNCRRKQIPNKTNRLKTYQNTIFNPIKYNKKPDLVKQFEKVFELTECQISKAQSNLKQTAIRSKHSHMSLIQIETYPIIKNRESCCY